MVDLNRDITDDERKMWQRVQEYLSGRPDDSLIPLTECGRRAGLHETRARQIAKTWANDGLVVINRDPNTGRLTTMGHQHSFEPDNGTQDTDG